MTWGTREVALSSAPPEETDGPADAEDGTNADAIANTRRQISEARQEEAPWWNRMKDVFGYVYHIFYLVYVFHVIYVFYFYHVFYVFCVSSSLFAVSFSIHPPNFVTIRN